MAAKSALSSDLPWPGTAPYTTADRTYFHGRKRETEELLRLIQRDVITLVMGATGVGKTSLIQAGLLPALAETEWLPVMPKLDWSATPPQSTAPDLDPDIVVSLGNPLSRKVIEALMAASAERNFSSPEPKPGETLWEYFHRAGNRWWSTRQRVVTPIVIIDGFESVFTTAEQNATAERHAAGFLRELSQLASNRPPQRLATRLENGTASQESYNFDPVPLRLVLVMRDEYASHLIRLRSLFPTLQRSELRLEAFTTSQARDILMRGSLQNSLMSDAALDAVVVHLATDRPSASEISPTELSTLAQGLALARKERGVTQITPEFLPPRGVRTAPPAIPAVDPSRETRELREKLAASENRRRGSQRMTVAIALAAAVAAATPLVRDHFSPQKTAGVETAPETSRSPAVPVPVAATPVANDPEPVSESPFAIAAPEFLPGAPATPAPLLPAHKSEPAPKPSSEGLPETPNADPEKAPHAPATPAHSSDLGQAPETIAPAPAPIPATPVPSSLSPEAQRQLNGAAADRKEQQRREFLRRQQEGKRGKEAAPR